MRLRLSVGVVWVMNAISLSGRAPRCVWQVGGAVVTCFAMVASASAAIAVGAAPEGDSAAVASRIIKYNFPNCRRVTGPMRLADGSIRARCDNIDYMVFTVFNAKEGRLLELAMNCTAAKSLLKVSC